MPENTGVQPRRLVGHDFKVVFQPLNLKLRDHLNFVLGLLLLKEISVLHGQGTSSIVDSVCSAAAFCIVCRCQLAVLHGAGC